MLAALGLLLTLSTGAAVLLWWQNRPVAPVAQDQRGPVLLVAGYGGSTDALDPLRRALAAQGRIVVLVPPVGDNTGDLAEQAEALDEAAHAAMRAHDAATVDVVGYSAGGVVARLWVRDQGGEEVARRVMTLGSPHHGSQVAALALGAGSCPTACRQLAPGSELLRRLNAGDETPPGPRWISVWSAADEVSTPPTTARLAGALDLSVQQLCPERLTTHGALPADPVVQALLDTGLGVAAPEAPQDLSCGR